MIPEHLTTVVDVKARAAQHRSDRRFDLVEALLTDAARAALYQAWRPEERETLAKVMRAHDHFGYARQLLEAVCEDEGDSEERRQQRAFCTYKDPARPAAQRYDEALVILREGGPLEECASGETLGLAGSIYKRRWALTADRSDLESARWCYHRGFELEDDEWGYCGINEAFVTDQLAAQFSDALGGKPEAKRLHADADGIRRELIAKIPADTETDWDRATLAEAHLALGNFAEAVEHLQFVHDRTEDGWKLETTATQLAELARLRDLDEAGTDDALTALLGSEPAQWRASLGKVGLALSGGGFRASLFHIGVLARLAEVQLLRQIEVLSCVSGGSIVGAYYALKLRDVLRTRNDEKITGADYVALVHALASEFMVTVRQDLRNRVPAEARANWEMLSTAYSRTERVGDLIEQLLFSQIPRDDDGAWLMTDLIIDPPGRTGFRPRYENWSRAAKVPVLVLNATTLNTGHCWQFTPTWMGETPAGVDADVNSAPRLRRLRYQDAPEDHQRMPLARAVAASACVPGLFPPVRLRGLFENVDVELVDGGVHDNQGVASLLEQDCDVILVSDASGQVADRDRPGRTVLGVATRSNTILMSRVRGAQLVDLSARKASGRLRRLMVVHLKKGLPVEPRDWAGCQEPYPDQPSETRYEIAADVQRAISELRTDLDRFTDDEAFALMAAGYEMARHEIAVAFKDVALPEPIAPREPWPFAAMLERLDETDGALARALQPGHARFMRAREARRLERGERPQDTLVVIEPPMRVLLAVGKLFVRVMSAPLAWTGALLTRSTVLRQRKRN